jgi:hypothetical protein
MLAAEMDPQGPRHGVHVDPMDPSWGPARTLMPSIGRRLHGRNSGRGPDGPRLAPVWTPSRGPDFPLLHQMVTAAGPHGPPIFPKLLWKGKWGGEGGTERPVRAPAHGKISAQESFGDFGGPWGPRGPDARIEALPKARGRPDGVVRALLKKPARGPRHAAGRRAYTVYRFGSDTITLETP